MQSEAESGMDSKKQLHGSAAVMWRYSIHGAQRRLGIGKSDFGWSLPSPHCLLALLDPPYDAP